MFSALLACAHAHAQTVYRWVDENGEVHYSQTLPPDRVRAAHDQLESDGRISQRIDRALTAEEQAAIDEQLALEASIAERERLKAQQDRLFMAAYPTEEDVRELARSQALVLEAEREAVDGLIEHASAAFSARVAEAAELERRGQTVSDYLRDSINNARAQLSELHERSSVLDRRLDQLREQLVEDLERHRTLTAAAG
ncbi:MAG: DUF4124 domain-containing protein [Symploca sp. SIO2G7]|nr:DUF4124 domain-containing protein [Symploca sp. SIO2G7]